MTDDDIDIRCRIPDKDAARIPLADLLAITDAVFRGQDFATDCGTPLPEGEQLTPEQIRAALPSPDQAGLVDGQEAIQAIVGVIDGRQLTYRRRHQLLWRYYTAVARYEGASIRPFADPADAEMIEAEPVGKPASSTRRWLPRCQVCGAQCGDLRARYCTTRCRMVAYRARKRAGERA